VNVSKAAGDSVAEDEVIAQIETDKVTIDVRAPHAGTISNILVRCKQQQSRVQ
jgi:2-oxoglutarate dehydrogenase E2 component (dihydrolipoamide succinyltransferase)